LGLPPWSLKRHVDRSASMLEPLYQNDGEVFTLIRLPSGKKIIDFHAHFWAIRKDPTQPDRKLHPSQAAYNKERSDRMALEWDHSDSPEPKVTTAEAEDVLIDRWAAEVEKYDLGAVNFLTGSNNVELARVIKKYPGKFFGFVHHDPAAPDSLEQLKYGVEVLGLKGYKMFGPRQDLDWMDPHLIPIWRYMAEKKLPLLIHFGPLGRAGGIVYHKHMSPLTIFPVADAFPDIPIVVPHFGCGYMRELLHLCWSCPNIYVDTSGSNQWMRWEPHPMDVDLAFRKYYDTIGAKRIIFGTDSMWFPRGFVYRYLQDQMRSVRCLNFHEEDIEAIFHDNAAQLLKIGPQAAE
jgi:predicted TIM-barrel fold metal-dependent hydrolase